MRGAADSKRGPKAHEVWEKHGKASDDMVVCLLELRWSICCAPLQDFVGPLRASREQIGVLGSSLAVL
eukprot:4593786-Pyramimonas_sp.AAC.1